ncbi:MAG: hypothetical protein N3B18_11105 [Desulfobacterota bacterium]|nr:hypothetical protein [Thermodesulfobacteriota bacterium]
MHDEKKIQELIAVLEANGVHVREEKLEGSAGGLCMLNGRRVLFLDATAPITTRLDQCLIALQQCVDTESVYLRPWIRALLEAQLNGIEQRDVQDAYR